MSKGYFIVSQNKENPRDILFTLESKEPTDAPEDQLTLKTEVERVLTTLQLLYVDGNPKFEENFDALLSLAQCGLVGSNAQPDIATRALMTLKEEIVLREAGRIKNKYLKELGKFCLGMSIPSILIVLYSLFFFMPVELFCFGMLWAGATIGVWLSYAYRKTHMRFEDLTLVEKDHLEPPIRIIFVGLITIILGLILLKQGLVIDMGQITTKDIGTDPITAYIIGSFCGFSEQVLPSKFAKRVASIFESK